ncbi:penicillin-binding protein activator [Sneathiella aquimaris]|uniref:penicillin-binding protein activator n=1 Tax=Sneathiella aquimaris TaxID=2599305 RepID=UPI00146CDC36|nr:penicillin-binding protein activator [Sneathiella aquimaris]
MKASLPLQCRTGLRQLINPLLIGALMAGILSACQTLGQDPATSTEKTETTAETKATTDAAQKASPSEADMLAEKKRAEALLAEQLAEEIQQNALNNQPAFSLRPPGFSDEAGTIRMAILLPLTGQYEKIGNDLLKAAYMALFDHGNKKLHLLPYDTKGTPEGARDAALNATGEGAEIILGPLFSGSVQAVRPIAAANNINVLAFSTDTAVAGDGVYLMGLTAGQQINRIMDYSYRQGLARFAILAPESPYGDTVVASVQQESARLGLTLDRVLRYPANLQPGSEELQAIAKDIANYDARAWQLRQEINKLKGKTDAASKAKLKELSKLDTIGDVSFDALIIPEGGQRLRELAPLLSYYDVDPTQVQFIGTGLWADRRLTTEPALVGGWFAAPDPVKTDQFQQRFAGLYGYTPPRISSLAYDVTALSGLLALEENAAKFSREVLENKDGFSGYNGVFRFLPTGVAERGLAVMIVGQQDLELLEAAPASFEALIN